MGHVSPGAARANAAGYRSRTLTPAGAPGQLGAPRRQEAPVAGHSAAAIAPGVPAPGRGRGLRSAPRGAP